MAQYGPNFRCVLPPKLLFLHFTMHEAFHHRGVVSQEGSSCKQNSEPYSVNAGTLRVRYTSQMSRKVKGRLVSVFLVDPLLLSSMDTFFPSL